MEEITDNRSKNRSQFTALAVLCLASGFLLTLDNLNVLTGVWRLWPIFPFFLGVGAFLLFGRRVKKELIPLGIGAFLIQISIFFFILNYTSWTLMATLWPVFIGVFGTTILVVAYFAKPKKWLIVSGLFSVFLAIVFYVVFTVEARLWPISLILFGIWLLLIQERISDEKKRSDN